MRRRYWPCGMPEFSVLRSTMLISLVERYTKRWQARTREHSTVDSGTASVK